MKTTSVPVDGGELAVGMWNEDAPGRAVVALHGITASHRAWQELAPRLPGVRVIAPDLRGRGRSNALPGPYGMDRHADDISGVLRELDVVDPLVIGHSMGAFAVVELLHRHGDLIGGAILIDGGLPLVGAATAEGARDVLGPAAERLSMTFPTRDAYREFWQTHPAFVGAWSASLESYVDYDLDETPEGLKPATVPDAMVEDSLWLSRNDGISTISDWPGEITLLAAPRGLQNEPVPLYSSEELSRWHATLPNLRVAVVDDVNHYTIVMGASGAHAVAEAVAEKLASLDANAATEVRS